jgi:asparagine synthase (glutamine-hydrolysing)
MADQITHRGPDDSGFFQDEHVLLGMRRLSIIDLAGGHQPIANEDETLRVVCNGEIYNFRNLRLLLESAGHHFRTQTDVEVLLHLYEQHGERFLDQVEGMFGFAMWDAPRRRLTLARDRLGQKPVYYFVGTGFLAFASEIKALLALPQVKVQVDRDALAEYLRLGYCVAPNTIFAGIKKLPPASRLIWQPSGWRVEKYWKLPETVREKLTTAQWVEQIREGLSRSVADHMVSDVPIGAFLSGGLDSSAIVGLMSRHSDLPVNTYSIGYAGGRTAKYYNELAYARQVANRYHTNHHEILVRPDVTALLPKIVWHLEEPISDSAGITTYLVSQLAAQSVKVILSGVGGDELFAGYRRYLGDHYAQRFHRLPRWVNRRVLRPLAELLPSGRQNRVLDFARYAKRFIQASDLSWGEQYSLYLEICSRARVQELFLNGETVADGFDRIVAAETADDALLRLMRVDAQTQLAEDLLLLTDKVTMATSIECRAPFLDHGLAELAAQIPASSKLVGGELKYLLKRALVGVLPEDILARRKRGFGAPVGEWFKSELRPLLDVLLSRQSIERRGLLSWPAVRGVLAAHAANREDYSDLILVLLNLEIWCRLFMDNRVPHDVSEELAEMTRAA